MHIAAGVIYHYSLEYGFGPCFKRLSLPKMSSCLTTNLALQVLFHCSLVPFLGWYCVSIAFPRSLSLFFRVDEIRVEEDVSQLV